MTECNTQAIKFSRLPRRQVLADFQGGRLTSDTGLLLLREVDRQIGLTEAISDCLHDPRDYGRACRRARRTKPNACSKGPTAAS